MNPSNEVLMPAQSETFEVHHPEDDHTRETELAVEGNVVVTLVEAQIAPPKTSETEPAPIEHINLSEHSEPLETPGTETPTPTLSLIEAHPLTAEDLAGVQPQNLRVIVPQRETFAHSFPAPDHQFAHARPKGRVGEITEYYEQAIEAAA